MGLILIITILCFGFSLLQSPPPCVALPPIQVQQSLPKANEVQIPLETLPRKLKISRRMVEGDGEVHGKRGTRVEWEAADYFTMDYSRVRRRRPIHNKSLPPSRH